MEHLTKVFESLQQHHLAVKLSKCTFVENKVEYLGHVISSERVTTDPRKIRAIQEWGVPSTTRQVKGFLGLAGYYRSFIKKFCCDEPSSQWVAEERCQILVGRSCINYI